MPTAQGCESPSKLLSGMDMDRPPHAPNLGARRIDVAAAAHSRRIPTVYLSMMPSGGGITPPPNLSTRHSDWQGGVQHQPPTGQGKRVCRDVNIGPPPKPP